MPALDRLKSAKRRMPLVEPPVKRAADNILLNIKRRERLQMLGRNLRIGMVKKYPASRRNRGPRIQLPAAIGLVSFQAGPAPSCRSWRHVVESASARDTMISRTSCEALNIAINSTSAPRSRQIGMTTVIGPPLPG